MVHNLIAALLLFKPSLMDPNAHQATAKLNLRRKIVSDKCALFALKVTHLRSPEPATRFGIRIFSPPQQIATVDLTESYAPTVNAYNNSSMNEIVFPAGIMQPPFTIPRLTTL